MYRQGDLLLVPHPPFEGDDDRRRLIEDGVVQLGEATGHAHVLEKGEVWEMYQTTYLTSDGGAQLVHDEHDTITLPEGTYRVLRQREFDPVGSWSNVAD